MAWWSSRSRIRTACHPQADSGRHRTQRGRGAGDGSRTRDIQLGRPKRLCAVALLVEGRAFRVQLSCRDEGHTTYQRGEALVPSAPRNDATQIRELAVAQGVGAVGPSRGGLRLRAMRRSPLGQRPPSRLDRCMGGREARAEPRLRVAQSSRPERTRPRLLLSSTLLVEDHPWQVKFQLPVRPPLPPANWS
jgi:hypothetical protein